MLPLRLPQGPTGPQPQQVVLPSRQRVPETKHPKPTYLPLGVPIAVFVLIPQGELQWIMILDFLVGHFLADTLGRHRGHYTSRARLGGQPWGAGPGRGDQVPGPWRPSQPVHAVDMLLLSMDFVQTAKPGCTCVIQDTLTLTLTLTQNLGVCLSSRPPVLSLPPFLPVPPRQLTDSQSP